jgi:hypothetical protein
MKRAFASMDERTEIFRGLAEFHTIGIMGERAQENRRLIQLAIREAEALACETGFPELVLLTLAEEKVRAMQSWIAKQDELKNRSLQWALAA